MCSNSMHTRIKNERTLSIWHWRTVLTDKIISSLFGTDIVLVRNIVDVEFALGPDELPRLLPLDEFFSSLLVLDSLDLDSLDFFSSEYMLCNYYTLWDVGW